MFIVMMVAVAALEAPAYEQEELIYQLYNADPVLAAEVLDLVDDLSAAEADFQKWDRGYEPSQSKLQHAVKAAQTDSSKTLRAVEGNDFP